MCGIVGYTGQRQAIEVAVEGLGRLEYRGYDSAGIALVGSGGLVVEKRAGKLANLRSALVSRPAPPSTVGIGHTRWATHGAPTDRNAHPHTDCHGRIAVIHNGIIENFAVLRTELEDKGHRIVSETDTEVVAHLLEEFAAGGLAEAMRRVCLRLEGAFTLLAVSVDEPEVVVGAGVTRRWWSAGGRGELPRLGRGGLHRLHARGGGAGAGPGGRAASLEDHGLRLPGAPVETRDYHVGWDASAAEKDGYDHFMLKEIAEQPRAVADTLLGRVGQDGLLVLDEMRLSDQELRDINKIILVACGTSYHAGLIAKYAIEHWARLPCEVEVASEFRYRDPILTRDTLVIVISQSGETMDTLMAVRHARGQRSRVLAVCNVNGSTISRESDAVLYTHAARGRGGLHQGVPHPAGGLLPGGALPRAGPGHEVRRRDHPDRRPAGGDAVKGERGPLDGRAGPRAGQVAGR